MENNNPYWMTGGTWYNTSICKNYMEQCLNNLLEIQELIDIISYVLYMNMKKSIRHLLMMAAAVVVICYH